MNAGNLAAWSVDPSGLPATGIAADKARFASPSLSHRRMCSSSGIKNSISVMRGGSSLAESVCVIEGLFRERRFRFGFGGPGARGETRCCAGVARSVRSPD
jgi:hypothetical protein